MKHHDMMHHKHHSSHGIYRNEVEKPEMPHQGHMESGWGCMDFKGEADPIAMGQAGGPGMKSDEHRIHSQMKQYHWD